MSLAVAKRFLNRSSELQLGHNADRATPCSYNYSMNLFALFSVALRNSEVIFCALIVGFVIGFFALDI